MYDETRVGRVHPELSVDARAQWKTQYNLTFTSSQGGSISPELGWYDEGTKLTISAIPDLGAVFDSWTGTIGSVPSGSSTSFPLTVTQPIWTTAVFRIEDNPPEVEIIEGPKGTVNDRTHTFEWEGSDDVSKPDALHYTYKLEGYDDGWSDWTPLTSKTYTEIDSSEYTFLVKTRDEAGVISEVIERDFTVSLDSTITIWGKHILKSDLGLALTIIVPLGGVVIAFVRDSYLNYLKRKQADELFRHRMLDILKAKEDLDELDELSDNIASDHFVNRLLNKTQFEQLNNKLDIAYQN